MLIVVLKSIITFALVLLIIRLMGKRQIGEMQPFELVITLIIAEVGCIPMNDPQIPFYYGLVPIITLGTVHLLLSVLARKSLFARRMLSGKSVIVIDKDGINYQNLKKMNINMNDLIEAVRSSGNADFNQIQYAIFETNGKICVITKPSDPNEVTPALLPITLLIDGKVDENNLNFTGVTLRNLENAFNKNGIKKLKDVLYADVRQDGTLYVAPKRGKCFTENLTVSGGAW